MGSGARAAASTGRQNFCSASLLAHSRQSEITTTLPANFCQRATSTCSTTSTSSITPTSPIRRNAACFSTGCFSISFGLSVAKSHRTTMGMAMRFGISAILLIFP